MLSSGLSRLLSDEALDPVVCPPLWMDVFNFVSATCDPQSAGTELLRLETPSPYFEFGP